MSNKFILESLPYAIDGLEPFISQETLEHHYGKHHQAYVDKLNGFLEKAPLDFNDLADVIKASSGALFNNAAQVWNHSFYWSCMVPGGKAASDELVELIEKDFGDFADFKQHFMTAWVWLVRNKSGKLMLRSTTNADTPLTDGELPLLVCDVWEHAYYIDVRNRRPEYLNNFWQLINWQFVEQQLTNGYTISAVD